MEKQTMAVQRMQDYVLTHISQEIILADLANAAMFFRGMPTDCSGQNRIVSC